MWVVLAILILLPLSAIVGALVYRYVVAGVELQQALAETDRLDPHWRLEDVEAGRAVIPDERNSGEVAMTASRLLPKRWPAWDVPVPGEVGDAAAERRALQESFMELEPQRQLDAEQLTALGEELERAAAARDQARKLADLPEGRYPITYSQDFLGTLLPHTQDVRGIANLLGYDVLLRAQQEDIDGALTSCRAILNAGRSIGDEPFIISALVRIACRATSVVKTQRALAQGQPTETALVQLQQLLEKEETEPLTLIALRGERAGANQFMEALQAGKNSLSAAQLEKTAGLSGPGAQGPTLEEELDMRSPGFTKSQHAAMLRYMNRAIEIAKLAPQEQRQQFQELDATRNDQPILVRLVYTSLSKFVAAQQRSQAQLRCAAAALAAERYRRAKGAWPPDLDALVAAGYLRELPTDIYDGKPLRFKRLENGLVIYSIGPDGEDNGGNIERVNPAAQGTDVGIHLWDPAQRRQAAAPHPQPRVLPAILPPHAPPGVNGRSR
jgi:hypothetical protein